jgi:hypothetical protein
MPWIQPKSPDEFKYGTKIKLTVLAPRYAITFDVLPDGRDVYGEERIRYIIHAARVGKS